MKRVSGGVALAILALPCTVAFAQDRVEDARVAVRTKEFEVAVALLGEEAQSGSDEAEYLLGLASASGIGREADIDVARSLLTRAARRGHARAAHALAALLAAGDDSQRREAREWLAVAARQGYAPAVATHAAGKLPLSDPRADAALPEDLRWQVAQFAARANAVGLLRALGSRELPARRDEFGRTLMMIAIEHSATDVIDELLVVRPDLEAQDRFGRTALMLAARHTDVELTRRLIRAGARVDAADESRRSALFYAAASDRPAQARELLAAGAVLDARDIQGANALDVAQKRGSTATADVLRAAGAIATSAPTLPRGSAFDPARPGALHAGWPPILVAVARDDEAEIRRLVAAGETITASTPRGDSALQVAIDARAARSLAVLLELGADPHLMERGRNAVHRIAASQDEMLIRAIAMDRSLEPADRSLLLGAAVRLGDHALVRFQLAQGASASAQDPEGRTPLTVAAAGGGLEMVKLLLDRGASPVDRDSRGAGPLLHAVSARQAAVVALLLELNAPVNDTDERGLTPLVAAIGAGDAALARQLLQAGATIGKSVNGSPPLHVAAERGDLAVIEALLEGRPDLDALDSFGETALLVAARQGHEAICARLLSAGANIRLRGRDRATAADVAEARGFVALARRLRG